MGVKCQIVINPNNQEVVKVLDRQGNESTLFNEAVQYYNGDRSEALDLWTTAYTDDFIEYFGDFDEEPNVQDVVVYIEDQTKGALNKLDKLSIFKSFLSSGLSSFKNFSSKLKQSFIEDNRIVFDRDRLVEGDLFSNLEIDNILQNQDVRDDIKDTLLKMEVPERDIVVIQEDAVKLTNLDDLQLLGNFSKFNNYEIDKIFREAGALSDNVDDFLAKVSESELDSLVTQLESSQDVLDRIFNEYKDYVPAPIYHIQNGDLVEGSSTSLQKYVQVLEVDNNNDTIYNTIQVLASTSPEMWVGNKDDIKDVVKSVEKMAIDFGIDIIGLSDLVYSGSRDEVMNILTDVANVTSKLRYRDISPTQLGAEMPNIIEFNDRNLESISYVKNNTDAESIIHLDTSLSEEYLFNEFSLVKVGDNLFQRVNKEDNTKQMVEGTLELAKAGYSNIPSYMFYPSGIDSEGKLSQELLNRPTNQDNLISNMYSYLNNLVVMRHNNASSDVDSLIQLELYKVLYGVDPSVKNFERIASNFNEFNGNSEYLTSDFLIDFNKEMLKQKFEDTPLYNDLLSYFYIDLEGIKSVRNDVAFTESVNFTFKDSTLGNSIKNYSILSKNPNISRIFVAEYSVPTTQSTRDTYVNNPELVDVFEEEYYVNDEVLVTKHYDKDFLKVNGEDSLLFEKIDTKVGLGVYKPLPSISGNVFNLVNVSIDSSYKTNILTSRDNTLDESFVSSNNIASRVELQEIKDKIDSCAN